MKEAPRSKLLDDLPFKVIDQNAQTTGELGEASGLGRSTIHRYINANLKQGIWEQVWKRSKGRLIPAFRRVKKV